MSSNLRKLAIFALLLLGISAGWYAIRGVADSSRTPGADNATHYGIVDHASVLRWMEEELVRESNREINTSLAFLYSRQIEELRSQLRLIQAGIQHEASHEVLQSTIRMLALRCSLDRDAVTPVCPYCGQQVGLPAGEELGP